MIKPVKKKNKIKEIEIYTNIYSLKVDLWEGSSRKRKKKKNGLGRSAPRYISDKTINQKNEEEQKRGVRHIL